MKFEDIEVWGFRKALKGMRNPKNSWDKSDSVFGYNQYGNCKIYHLFNECRKHDPNGYAIEAPVIGTNDMKLAQQLIRTGSEHRKFMRQIFVSVDITAPLYWFKEFDTYKVGTIANSTSTMHKLASTPITLDCFEIDDYEKDIEVFENPSPMKYSVESFISDPDGFIDFLESLRKKYLDTKNKKYWKELIRWLPESWLQTRTITMSFENLYVMVHQRENHKLSEWSISFINWVHTLPYSKEFIFANEVNK